MELDTLLTHYFGTQDLEEVEPAALARGREQLALDFGVEREGGRRFALWALMEALGDAPPPAEAFKEEPALRRAADDYLTLAWRMPPE